ncbi:terpenoid synthase [Peniophora sp. CONT]|nr:terpenoid synthase [Peniophora sp. CONT]
MIATRQQRYRIPDCLANWPWPRRLNNNYAEAKTASAVWMQSFQGISPRTLYAYDRCDFSLLASMVYLGHDAARLRTACDVMALFFFFDDSSDVVSPEEVLVMVDVMMDALRNPHKSRPVDEWIGGEVTRQFWELAIKTASPGSQERFIDRYAQYTKAVVRQAEDRQNKVILTVEEYFPLRRDTIGAKPAFAFLELNLDRPQAALNHPVIGELEILSTDMIILSNDIVSYNKEQARGDDYQNIVTSIMHHHQTDVQGAMNWVESHYLNLQARFLELYCHHVPKYHSYQLDADIAKYVDGLGNWVRANDQWNFETERYLGKRGIEIFKERWVTLMPKEHAKDIGQLINDALL